MREYKMRTFLLNLAQFPRSVILTGVGRNRESMWFLFFLLAAPCTAEGDLPPDECFNITEYIVCSEIKGRPDACDCSGVPECYIKFTITSYTTASGDINYFVDGKSPGPTIIADYHAYVVVDIYNEMSEDTSVHWHGMHQVNVPWIDGVGNVTQYPIPPYGRFRYIFQAFPQGTHWYHSHMRLQRDHGLFGMLIIHEPESDIQTKLGEFIDDPKRKSLAILDNMQNQVADRFGKAAMYCLPDGSRAPADFSSLTFILNGANLARNFKIGFQSNLQENDPRLLFYVVPGKKYRFRILAAMLANMFMISIDQHKLNVIATDGYLVKTFETDFLIMHVAERYDFILDAKVGVKPGTLFPINIQSLAGLCEQKGSQVAAKTFAYIKYLDPPVDRLESPKILPTRPLTPLVRCTQNRRCKILNCPFKMMPPSYDNGMGEFMDCYDVRSLRLLYPTIPKHIPSKDISSTSFFNFRKYNDRAVINGVVLTLPEIPVIENNNHNYECKYPVHCVIPLRKKCTHAVYVDPFESTIRFVLSAMDPDNSLSVTHPIHMHGHSFFVSKIGYPTYNNKTGTIISHNKDVHVPYCGAGNWTNGPPEDISVDRRTVRKDVIIVPAGGYVVIEFIADNPGYWFMHCHIDFHLLEGMGIIIGEVPERASTPPDGLNTDTGNFCFSVKTFIEKQSEVNVQVHAPNDF